MSLGCRTSSPNTSSSFSAALLDWIRKESWYAVRVRVLWGTARAALCRCAGAVALASCRQGVVALWYQSRSMRSMLVRLEHIAICGRWSSYCYPLSCVHLYLWHSLIEAAHEWHYAFHGRLVPQLTYGLHRIKVASRVPVSPTIVDMASTTEGP
jgi:hypothetical protein